MKTDTHPRTALVSLTFLLLVKLKQQETRIHPGQYKELELFSLTLLLLVGRSRFTTPLCACAPRAITLASCDLNLVSPDNPFSKLKILICTCHVIMATALQSVQKASAQ